ncbi:RNA polymerase sigma factor [Phaeodactylibacter xiamenensis]|uniref:RNA polymerase sigma factor n=1 Tax=Phaeodactylibacter xiamenensis TaxID=1524460 RepID=UPI003BA887DD
MPTTKPQYSDEQLLKMIRGSEQERANALKAFFTDQQLRASVIRKIQQKGGSANDAQDAFQEGFKAFYRHLLNGKFEGRSSLRTFFVGICIRCWLDGLKKSFYQRTTLTDKEETLDDEYEHTPETRMMSRERKSQLQKVLALLGDRCKKVIMMGYEGYNSEEIKQKLEIEAEEAVRKIRYRCMTKLKEKLASQPTLNALLKSLSYG